MSEASTSDTLRASPGQTTRGISMKSREPSMLNVAGAVGQNLHFKVHSLSGS